MSSYTMLKKVNSTCALYANRYTLIAPQRGYVVLLTVLVVGAVAVAIATTLLFAGTDAARLAAVKEQSRVARHMADACAEEALNEIRTSSPFTGYGTLTLGGNTCSFNVTNLGGTNRQVIASSTVGTMVRKKKLTLDKVKPVSINSEQDVINF